MLLAFLFAVFLHELGHVVMILFTGGRITGVTLCPLGITLKAEYPHSYLAGILIAFGGPLCGLFCFFLFSHTSGRLLLFADISLGLSLFNLLPVSFLDGGGLLLNFLYLFLPYEIATAVSQILSYITIGILWLISIYLFLFLNAGASLFFLSLWLFSSLAFPKKKILSSFINRMPKHTYSPKSGSD